MSPRVIFPARRAVEHVMTVPGVQPLRLFPLLWPLWRVETSAQIYDEQAYEVVDGLLAQGVVAELSTVDDLAGCFGVRASLVRRCLAFLSTIGHVQVDGGVVHLTQLGERSAREGVRYVPKESRQDLLIERFTVRPLPRRHYDGAIEILATPTVPSDRLADRTRFLPLHSTTPFQAEPVQRLADRPDRTELNLPRFLHDLRVIAAHDAFLPVYVIETATSGLLAYSAAGPRRDRFFEEICRDLPSLHAMIAAEEHGNPRQIWTQWLAAGTGGRGTLRQLRNGVWRATLRADAFDGGPERTLSRVGSFILRRYHFLQLWCDDAGLRRRALLERALALTQSRDIRSRADLNERVGELAAQLEVGKPGFAELRDYGEHYDLHGLVARFDQLE